MRYLFLFLFALLILLDSCTKDKTKVLQCPVEISFKSDLMPILNNNCSTSGCHDFDNASGGLVLDSANAYSQLTASGAGYVDTTNVNNSLFYVCLIQGGKDQMPQDLPPLPDSSISKIKCWIIQGAHNN